jgi:adenylate cyclase
MLGYAYSRLGCHEKAIEELERAVVLAPKIYEIRGALYRELRTIGRQEDANRHYALAAELASADDDFGQASFAAVTGDVDRALNLLEVALSKGQTHPGWILVDPDLDLIKDDPRFTVLVEGSMAQ